MQKVFGLGVVPKIISCLLENRDGIATSMMSCVLIKNPGYVASKNFTCWFSVSFNVNVMPAMIPFEVMFRAA